MINIKLYSENRRILQIAIPSIISNITVPLLGLIDVTIVGHLGSPAYIGAIAVGGMLFNIIYCCLLYTSPSPRDGLLSRMPSSA